MDRTAWIVVALCVIGLVVWEIYLAKQMARDLLQLLVRRTSFSHGTSSDSRAFAVSDSVAEATPKTTGPSFPEKIESLRIQMSSCA